MMKLKKGMYVTCKIVDVPVYGRIQRDNKANLLFICQNVKEGQLCEDRLGFKYGWCIGSGTDEELEYFSVSNLKEVEEPSSIEYSKPGDILAKPGLINREVLAVVGKLIGYKYVSHGGDTVYWNTLNQLKNDGYKIKLQETVEEDMIDVDGKKVSISTVKEALRSYLN